MKKIFLIFTLLFSILLFACEEEKKLDDIIEEEEKLDDIIEEYETSFIVGTGFDRSVLLGKLGFVDDKITNIHNERQSTWEIENPELLEMNGTLLVAKKSGTTKIYIKGINTNITINVTINELEYFDGININMSVGDIINIEELLNSYPTEVVDVTFDASKLYYKDNKLLALCDAETELNVFFTEGSVTLPVKVKAFEDYIQVRYNIMDQIDTQIYDYRDFEPVISFTNDYINRIDNEKNIDAINAIYDEFCSEFDELLLELNNNYKVYAEEFAVSFETYFSPYSDDERVKNVIEEQKFIKDGYYGSLLEIIQYNRMCYYRAQGYLMFNETYYEQEKNTAINNINNCFEKHKNCDGALEIKDKWVDHISKLTINESVAVEAVWDYDDDCIHEIRENHYEISNKEGFRIRNILHMSSLYDTYVNEKKIESLQEVCYKYFDQVIECKDLDEFMNIYSKYIYELDDLYKNSSNYLNSYKSEIKNNIDIMYEDFYNQFSDLSNEFSLIEDLCDEYKSKIDISDKYLDVENLYMEFQEKFYTIIDGLE